MKVDQNILQLFMKLYYLHSILYNPTLWFTQLTSGICRPFIVIYLKTLTNPKDIQNILENWYIQEFNQPRTI